ncbi:MAG TPA: sensor histidine kinase, partial [Jatrophihabitantaceae bacterium]|nr:sensor histidine kinase [Jatrophihabitantaceae bacterium]
RTMDATMSTVRNRMRKLSSQIFVAQLGILTVTMGVGFALFAHAERNHLDAHYEQRAAAIAETVAVVPAIRSCMANERPGCASTIQRLATETQDRTKASYVVLIDMNRVRHSHPIPDLIGKKVAEPIVARDGKIHVRIDHGKTGSSANAIAPLYGPGGVLAGEVSVGIPESSVSTELANELPSYAAWFLIALGIGALASWGLARRLKHQTFGLELDEIARLLQEREATLHGIREGVIAFDKDGRINVVNDEAQRLLRLPVSAPGSTLDEVLPEGRLRDVLEGRGTRQDDIVFTDDFCLVINRMPVTFAGRQNGAVVTLRDRTEMAALLRELDGERSLTESLRAQQHEFSNRMHAVAGLLELGRTDEALSYVTEVRGTAAEFDNTLRTHIATPQIVGLMLGKAAEASERGIELVLSPETWLGDTPEKVQALTTIVGNLIDNAFDAVATEAAPRRVIVEIVEEPTHVTVTVTDNGPGITPGTEQLIFSDGYTTKPRSDGRRGGLGLALIHRLVVRLHGSIEVSAGPGAQFVVRLPKSPAATPVEARGPS